MVPLGPWNGKGWATTCSAWVVTLDALELVRLPLVAAQTPSATHLKDDGTFYDINLKVEIIAAGASNVTCESNAPTALSWNTRHLLAHLVIGGGGLKSGDLIATGTVSGSSEQARGCLLEWTYGGKKPIALADDKVRRYLEDGDVVRFTGELGKGSGVGSGECIGELLPIQPLG